MKHFCKNCGKEVTNSWFDIYSNYCDRCNQIIYSQQKKEYSNNFTNKSYWIILKVIIQQTQVGHSAYEYCHRLALIETDEGYHYKLHELFQSKENAKEAIKELYPNGNPFMKIVELKVRKDI